MAVGSKGRESSQSSERVRAVLIDLDDTLFDHRSAARSALQAAAACDPALGGVRFDDLEARHRVILEDLHRAVLSGDMTVDAARELRFRTLIEEQGETCDTARLERLTSAYRGAYQSHWSCLPGAIELAAELKRRSILIAIVTNNIVSEQVSKLRRLGLEPYVDALVVSEAVGASKPDPRIFSHALDTLRVTADEAVMLGDNWRADIEGARASGIRPIWFNPGKAVRPTGDEDVMELTSLEPADAVADLILGHSVP